MSQEIQLVIFKLKQSDSVCEYAVPINRVQEIIKNNKPTRLPGSPDFLEGIISLRGRVIPIINLKKRFNLLSVDENDSCSVVVDLAGNTVGIMVDEVSEVLQMSTADIERPPAVIRDISAEFLVGIGKINERLLLILDVNRIFTDQEKEELGDFINTKL